MDYNFEMNASFAEVDESNKRYIVMKGSAGSGKSVDTAMNYILRLMNDKGRNLVCIRKSDISNRDSTYAELTGAIYRMFGADADKLWTIKQSPLQLTCRQALDYQTKPFAVDMQERQPNHFPWRER